MSILCHGLSLCWTSILDGCGVRVNFLMLPSTETMNIDLSVKSTLFFRLGQLFGFVPQQVSIDYFPSRTRRSLPRCSTLKITSYDFIKHENINLFFFSNIEMIIFL